MTCVSNHTQNDHQLLETQSSTNQHFMQQATNLFGLVLGQTTPPVPLPESHRVAESHNVLIEAERNSTLDGDSTLLLHGCQAFRTETGSRYLHTASEVPGNATLSKVLEEPAKEQVAGFIPRPSAFGGSIYRSVMTSQPSQRCNTSAAGEKQQQPADGLLHNSGAVCSPVHAGGQLHA